MTFTFLGRPCVAAAMAVAAITLQGCGMLKKPKECTQKGINCLKTGCCEDKSLKCWATSDTYASCKESCEDGLFNSCTLVTKGGEVHMKPTTTAAPVETTPESENAKDIKWIKGTWTTGYWDCCKPSCSWAGKGKLSEPIASCDAETGKKTDPNKKSVCDGGAAVTCANNQPFKVSDSLSMGFVAAAVSGKNGLTGDKNCGQCFELLFDGTQHIDKGTGDKWGGAYPDLVHRRMIVQVTNIGYDVTGNHSFDILIPGAGQGIFDKGCVTQYPKHKKDDFDCGDRHGGCMKKSGCADLPKELQKGCEWRYDWYNWMHKGGRTNNPYIWFRRVQCPQQLIDISGAAPDDDTFQPTASDKIVFA